MEPSTFSIKGVAAVTFKDKKEGMSSKKIWMLLKQISTYYPNRVHIAISSTRGADNAERVEEDDTKRAIMDLTGGCIETCDTRATVGQSVSLLLGTCYEYGIHLGTKSVDTGHETIIFAMPFPLEGCYRITANIAGSLKKSIGKEHYTARLDLDVHIGTITMDQYAVLVENGTKVFPFKLSYPEYFATGDSSESEFATDLSEDDDASSLADAGTEDSANSGKGKVRRRKLLNTKKRPLRSSLKRRITTSTAGKLFTALKDSNLNLLAPKEIPPLIEGPSEK